MKVGFIGLGNAGLAIATNLIKVGNELTVYDIRPHRMDLIKPLGAKCASSPKEVATLSEVVFTSLPHPKASEDVIMGENGVLAGASPGLILIELSTVSPFLIKRIGEAAKSKGVEVLDAGVSGGIARIIEGKLTLMIGGKREIFDKVQPLLDPISERIFYMGDLGSGMMVKVINNLISHVNMVTLCEAMALGVKAGISPDSLFEVIKVSSGDSWVLRDRVGTRILKRDFNGGMKLELAYKDSELALELGRALGVPLYVTSVAHSVYEHAKAKGIGEKDFSSVIMLWEEIIGKEVKSN